LLVCKAKTKQRFPRLKCPIGVRRTIQEITLPVERAMNERISFGSDRLSHCPEANNAKLHRDKE
jgi:hypothetical protein